MSRLNRDSTFYLPGTPLSDLVRLGEITEEDLGNFRVGCQEEGREAWVSPGERSYQEWLARCVSSPPLVATPVLPGEGPLPGDPLYLHACVPAAGVSVEERHELRPREAAPVLPGEGPLPGDLPSDIPHQEWRARLERLARLHEEDPGSAIVVGEVPPGFEGTYRQWRETQEDVGGLPPDLVYRPPPYRPPASPPARTPHPGDPGGVYARIPAAPLRGQWTPPPPSLDGQAPMGHQRLDYSISLEGNTEEGADLQGDAGWRDIAESIMVAGGGGERRLAMPIHLGPLTAVQVEARRALTPQEIEDRATLGLSVRLQGPRQRSVDRPDGAEVMETNWGDYSRQVERLGEEERNMSVIREVEFGGSDYPGSTPAAQNVAASYKWMYQTLERVFDQFYKCERGGVRETSLFSELRKLAEEFPGKALKPTF